MAQANYKITITEHDYEYTRYIAWVSGSSRIQAIAKAAALAGQCKARRESERTGRGVACDGLMDPEIKIEPAELDEYWDKRDTVEVAA